MGACFECAVEDGFGAVYGGVNDGVWIAEGEGDRGGEVEDGCYV